MPLPEANDYSKRIYQLLETTDLENLSYADFQGVAEKLFIEPENEDEMRRLVLVQLARMAVRGDWDGFLSGSSGSIGGSIADNQVAIGASIADTIEGSAQLTFNTGTLTLATGTDTPKVQLSNDSKAITLQVDDNNKLKVAGGSYSWTLDASTATAGITFPDGTTQITAAAGGGTNNVTNSLVIETATTFSIPLLENLNGQGNTGYGNRDVDLDVATDTGSFMYYRSFTASTTGTMSAIVNRCVTADTGASIEVAIYDSDSDGNPQTLIGECSVPMTVQYIPTQQTTITPSSTGSMDLTKGNLYWCGVGQSATSNAKSLGYFQYETQTMGLSATDAIGSGVFTGFTCLIGPGTPGATFSLLATGQRQALALGGLYS